MADEIESLGLSSLVLLEDRVRRHLDDAAAVTPLLWKLTFLDRLAALVPRPREHQLTHHGVLAPASRGATGSTKPRLRVLPASVLALHGNHA